MTWDRNDPNAGPEPGTLVILDTSLLRDGYVQFSNLVLLYPGLSNNAKILYAVLRYHARQAGSCFPGYDRLCAFMGLTENSVRRYMKDLQQVGLVEQVRQGLGKSNRYILPERPTYGPFAFLEPQPVVDLDPQQTADQKPQPPADKVDTVEVKVREPNGSLIHVRSAQSDTARQTLARWSEHGVTVRTVKAGPSKKPLAPKSSRYSPAFERFWETYPRRTNKGGAWQVWKARLAEKIDPEALIRAAGNAAAYWEAEERSEQYIPHAATFLGPQARFEEFLAGVPALPAIRNTSGKRDNRRESLRESMDRLLGEDDPDE